MTQLYLQRPSVDVSLLAQLRECHLSERTGVLRSPRLFPLSPRSLAVPSFSRGSRNAADASFVAAETPSLQSPSENRGASSGRRTGFFCPFGDGALGGVSEGDSRFYPVAGRELAGESDEGGGTAGIRCSWRRCDGSARRWRESWWERASW